MGFFSKILEKLGLKKDEAAKPVAAAAATAAPAKPAAAAAKPAGIASAGASTAKPAIKREKDEVEAVNDNAKGSPRVAEAAAPAVQAISEVDVVKQLEKLAEGSGLNWKVSIVDLLKILGIDSSREARNELATELGCPEDLMKDSAKMNVWLHKEVLRQIAANGGNIPQALLD